jgi:F0F1-type ATP synthase assembly protein I
MKSARADLARYGGLGMQLAATVGLLAWLGWRLDLWLGTKFVFLLVGVLLGFVGGFLSLLARVPPTSSENRRARAARSRDSDRSSTP